MLLKKLHQLPKLHRVLFMLLFVGLVYGMWGKAAFKYIGGMTLLMYMLFPEMWQNKETVYDKSKDIFGLLEVRGDSLRIGMHIAPIAVVRKVAMGEYDSNYGYISFPYTRKLQGNYIFPIGQLAPLREWFATQTPELEVIK